MDGADGFVSTISSFPLAGLYARADSVITDGKKPLGPRVRDKITDRVCVCASDKLNMLHARRRLGAESERRVNK